MFFFFADLLLTGAISKKAAKEVFIGYNYAKKKKKKNCKNQKGECVTEVVEGLIKMNEKGGIQHETSPMAIQSPPFSFNIPERPTDGHQTMSFVVELSLRSVGCLVQSRAMTKPLTHRRSLITPFQNWPKVAPQVRTTDRCHWRLFTL